LAAVLIVAGVIKIVAPAYVGAALRRVSKSFARRAARDPQEARRAGRTIGVVETSVGIALLLASGGLGVAVAVVAVTLFASFAVFVGLAIRRGSACGCWATLSEGPAGGAELGRAGALLAAALVVSVARVVGARDVEWTGTAVL